MRVQGRQPASQRGAGRPGEYPGAVFGNPSGDGPLDAEKQRFYLRLRPGGDGQAGLRAHYPEGQLLYYHVYENSIGPLHLPGLSQGQVKKIRLLATGQEVPVSHAWMHSDYPGLVFADLGTNPILPDPVDTVLEVELAE